MEVNEALEFAKRVALNIWQDPEAESVAGEALLNAMRTFDETKGNYRQWIARHVKLGVWDFMRRFQARHSETRAEGWWEYLYNDETDYTDIPLPIPRADWELLVEYYLEKVPLDVVAKVRDVSVYRVRKMMEAATEKLLESKS